MKKTIRPKAGRSYPLGATLYPEGANFCLFSKNATAVELLLFNTDGHDYPEHAFHLDPKTNKTFYYWHIFIPGIQQGQLYGWRVHGPFVPEEGYRFDPHKVLIDPYARAVAMEAYDRSAAIQPGDNCARAIKSIVVGPNHYDWEGDRPIKHPFAKSIIYEMHLGGFTKHPSSGVREEWRGTYRGLIEKIPYLKELGITAVELMPVQQFDPYDVPNEQLVNYWGYSPIAFFAPHHAYASTADPIGRINEFRDMVKALHRAGIEVILDVVFNHTAEGDDKGPTLSLKGIENRAYYLLEKEHFHRYYNFTGTGNSLNANHSVVRRMILDCLKYWVSEMHVDGFRFDLASVLARDENGKPIDNPPVLWSIESDPVLASTKIIAEAWDVHQYQVGSFIGDKWAEWNGQYRDDIRRFMKGDEGLAEKAARRLCASPDLFHTLMRDPNRSINFVDCHDGFTLNDLVSYNDKHNHANGEDNRDGTDTNFSWNCGTEGPVDNPEIEQLRIRQIKNFLVLLMVSQGTPMLQMGDEIRRSQQGNNNAYCQDDELSWFNWNQVQENAELLEFVKRLIRFNLSEKFFQEEAYWNASSPANGTSCTFHGTSLYHPDWGHYSHSLAYTLDNREYGHQLHVMINAYWEPLTFGLLGGKRKWKRIIDTYVAGKEACLKADDAPTAKGKAIEVQARSVVILYRKFDE